MPDIENRSQNSYTTPCNGVVSHGALADHTRGNKRKQNASMIFARYRRVMRVYLCAQTAVHTHLINHGYFDRSKKPEYPQFEPHAGIKTAQVPGSPLYICGLYTTRTVNFHYSLKLGNLHVRQVTVGPVIPRLTFNFSELPHPCGFVCQCP